MHHQEQYMEYKENKAKGGQNLDLKKKQRENNSHKRKLEKEQP